jgi:serine/threonine protein kinase
LEEVWEEGKRRRKNLTAPEVLLGGEANFASDVWSVGCVLSALLLGRLAFEARTGRQLMEHIYRGVGSYDNVWKLGQFLPYYPLCKPQRASGYAPRTHKHVRELLSVARGKKKLPISDEAAALLPALLHLNPMERPSARECLEVAPYFQIFKKTLPGTLISGVGIGAGEGSRARAALLQEAKDAWIQITAVVPALLPGMSPRPFQGWVEDGSEAAGEGGEARNGGGTGAPGWKKNPEALAKLFTFSSGAPPDSTGRKEGKGKAAFASSSSGTDSRGENGRSLPSSLISSLPSSAPGARSSQPSSLPPEVDDVDMEISSEDEEKNRSKAARRADEERRDGGKTQAGEDRPSSSRIVVKEDGESEWSRRREGRSHGGEGAYGGPGREADVAVLS